MTWNDGYVVDVAYTEQAYREMTPVWLSLASVLNRQPPVDTTRPFTYVELGCGRGLTACTIAATNPSAEVWACDFNPAHVERARQWATDARLDNCAFEEASFEDVAGDRKVGPSQADVIALHGVFSWVSPVNRRHIVDIIRTRLRPGGLVYVSYNVPTGWAGMLAAQQAMRLQVATDRRPSDVAIRSALATIQQLADEGGRAFPLGPREQPHAGRAVAARPGVRRPRVPRRIVHADDVRGRRRRAERRQVRLRRQHVPPRSDPGAAGSRGSPGDRRLRPGRRAA